MIEPSRLCALAAEAYSKPVSLEAADAHVILAEIDGVILVAFRGSRSLLDWWVDFKVFGHVAYDHERLGEIHAGMANDALAIAPLIDDAVGDRPIIVIGHSKGGGEATIYAADRTAKGRPPVGLWTFGCPKVVAAGNPRVTALLGGVPDSDYRHCDDPVPLVPLGFKHPRPLVQIVPPRFELDVIADHFIEQYAVALAA